MTDTTEPPATREVAINHEVVFGAGRLVVIAGPCAVETAAQIELTARSVRNAGAAMLRGGAFKPRTSPDSFQGLGEPGLELLSAAGARHGLPVVTEVLDPRDVERVAAAAQVLQIGSRNMQNVPLLREAGRTGLPVLLKRGAAATLEELVLAAEYVRREGNERVILCERGVRSFDPSTRYLLDLAAVPVLRERTDLPIVVDPSHGTGRRSLVPAMARAAVAAGCDGLLIEVHPDPERALSDGPQAMRPADFSSLMRDIAALASMLGRRLVQPGSPRATASS